jgi:hypothetical protein
MCAAVFPLFKNGNTYQYEIGANVTVDIKKNEMIVTTLDKKGGIDGKAIFHNIIWVEPAAIGDTPLYCIQTNERVYIGRSANIDLPKPTIIMNDDCLCCYEKLDSNCKITLCGKHGLCNKCYQSWIVEKRGTCPYCRI